jgi:SAM-dependent methyltransferase
MSMDTEVTQESAAALAPHTQSIYESGSYAETNTDWHAEDAPYKAQQLLKLLKRNQVTFRRCVDVGCGSGGVLRILASAISAEYIGFDIAPLAIERARRQGGRDITFRCENFVDCTDIADIGLVVCNDVFEHVPDYLGFLTQLGERAPRSSRYAFNIPLEMNLLHILANRHVHNRKRIGHLHYFSRATALATLSDCGFNVLDSFYTYPGLHMPHTSRSLLKQLAKIPRAALYLAPGGLGEKLLGGASLLVLAEKTRPSLFPLAS